MARPPPELMEDLVEEVLLRFPPDDPASLVRAALVCRLWRRLVSGAAFSRRFREFHRAAPVLGVLCESMDELDPDDGDDDELDPDFDEDELDLDDDDDDELDPDDDEDRPPATCFIPTSSFRPAGAHGHGLHGRRAVDARHGRVLLRRLPWGPGPPPPRIDLSVWDPATGEHRELPGLPLPVPEHACSWNAAVVCAAAAAGCDHLDCHRSSFLVVLVGITKHDRMFACIYASDRDATAWSEVAVASTAHHDLYGDRFDSAAGVLIGNTLCFLIRNSMGIVKFDLITQAIISVVDLPYALRYQNSLLITTEDGGLGLAAMDGKYKLDLWASEPGSSSNRDARFVLSKVIDLEKLLPAAALRASPHVSGFADGAGVIFVWTFDGVYSIGIKSEQIRRVPGCYAFDVVPYLSFHTPGSSSSSSRQA